VGLFVLVTGAAGNLGRQVCQKLLEHGHRVRALDIATADFAGLEWSDNVETAKGDIREIAFVRQAVEGCEWVLHLAAILPPASERDREQTMAINVEGTKNLVDALEASGGTVPMVFASSVATYGDTSRETPPVTVGRTPQPISIYGMSKVNGENLLRERRYPSAILRIGGIAVPALLEFPVPWPFTAEQRLEFISRDDVAFAFANCVGNRSILGRTLNISGGETWQLHGLEYVQGYYQTYDIPLEQAKFADRPGPYDWYETTDSQQLLSYKSASYSEFIVRLAEIVKKALGE